MRINKFIAEAGVCSRRDADLLISQGRVSINGQVLTSFGALVQEDDIVSVDDQILKPIQTKVYYLLNKPAGYVTTTDDQFGRPKVTDLVPNTYRVFPVGRLDYNTTGLIILTNDGEFANQITHPSFNLVKTYIARLDRPINTKDLDKLSAGILLSGRRTSPAEFTFIQSQNHSYVRVQIHEGRNRQIRRMFLALGYNVLELERIKIGPLELEDLPRGKFRELSKQEIDSISHVHQQS